MPSFKDELDALLEESGVNPVADTTPAPAAEPEQDTRSPLAKSIDSLLLQEGMTINTEVKEDRPYEDHIWESLKEVTFECDDYMVRCKRCCRTMKMSRDETNNQAMDKHGVSRDCSMQITAEIMTS